MSIRRSDIETAANFVRVPNAWMRDVNLSRRARGLLAELMTHRVGWHVSIGSLQRSGPEGRDAIRSAVAELVKHGYLSIAQSRGTHGRFNEVEYELCSPPTAVGKDDTGGKPDTGGISDTGGFTDSGSTDSGKTDVGESDTKKTSTSEDQPEEHQGEAPPVSRFCAKHPHGTSDNCGPCGDARHLYQLRELAQRSADAPRVPRVPREAEVANLFCSLPGHGGYPLEGPNRTCTKCERDTDEQQAVAS